MTDNLLRKKVVDFAVSQGICTRCFGRRVTKPFRFCDECLALKRGWKARRKAVLRKMVAKTKQREYVRRHVHKKLVEKVTKLDRIRRAVEQGKPLPVSTTFHAKK